MFLSFFLSWHLSLFLYFFPSFLLSFFFLCFPFFPFFLSLFFFINVFCLSILFLTSLPFFFLYFSFLAPFFPYFSFCLFLSLSLFLLYGFTTPVQLKPMDINFMSFKLTGFLPVDKWGFPASHRNERFQCQLEGLPHREKSQKIVFHLLF